MERYLVKYRVSDGHVIGTWTGKGNLPSNNQAGFALLEVSAAEMQEVLTKGLLLGNRERWKVALGQLEEIADSRPILRLSSYMVESEVGSTATVLTVTLVDDGGTTVPTTGTIKIILQGVPVNLVLVGGIGSLEIGTGAARDLDVGDGIDYRLEEPLRVRVYLANKF